MKLKLFFINRIEGGCVAHIQPDHLLDVEEFKSWIAQKNKAKDAEESNGYKNTELVCVESPIIPIEIFQSVSKKAWLDVLLQLLKICVVNRITPRAFKASPVPYNPDATFPDIKTDPLISNVIIYLFLGLGEIRIKKREL